MKRPNIGFTTEQIVQIYFKRKEGKKWFVIGRELNFNQDSVRQVYNILMKRYWSPTVYHNLRRKIKNYMKARKIIAGEIMRINKQKKYQERLQLKKNGEPIQETATLIANDKKEAEKFTTPANSLEDLQKGFITLQETITNVILEEVKKRVGRVLEENNELKKQLEEKNKQLKVWEDTFENLKESNWIDNLKNKLESN